MYKPQLPRQLGYARKARDPKINLKRRLARIHKNIRAAEMALLDLQAVVAEQKRVALGSMLERALATVQNAMAEVDASREFVIEKEF
jgi:hypothetical protein